MLLLQISAPSPMLDIPHSQGYSATYPQTGRSSPSHFCHKLCSDQYFLSEPQRHPHSITVLICRVFAELWHTCGAVLSTLWSLIIWSGHTGSWPSMCRVKSFNQRAGDSRFASRWTPCCVCVAGGSTHEISLCRLSRAGKQAGSLLTALPGSENRHHLLYCLSHWSCPDM